MSGLLMRLVDRWPRWFPRYELQSPLRPLEANGSLGLARIPDRSILLHLLLQLRPTGDPPIEALNQAARNAAALSLALS
jgi:hypothetical protein